MKLTYKQKLFTYFVLLFALFAAGVVVFQQSREKKLRTEALEEKLDAYSEIARILFFYDAGQPRQSTDSLVRLLPQNIRITIIDLNGSVIYDNSISDISTLGNHLQRPEILRAFKKGKGTDIRRSASNNIEYLYFAKKFGDHYIRAALPYDIQTRGFLKSDNIFLCFIIALFLGSLFFINIVAGRFGNSIGKLRDFALLSDSDDAVAPNIKFPDDELGEIGARIIENFKQLKLNRKKILGEREKLLQHVYSSEEGICFYSASGEVEFYNGLFIHYLNNIVDEAGSEPRAIFTDRAFGKLNDFLRSDHHEKYFEMSVDRQGKRFSLRVNIFEDRDFEVIINDITRQEKTRLLKQEMTGNIAHELRTPVTSIRGYLETVLEQPLDEQKQRYFLTQAFNQTMVLSELISDMSLITRMEGAPQSFSLEPVNIGGLLEDLKNDLALSLENKKIDMEWNIGRDVVVRGNRNLLYSIFRNLTDNVIRHAGSDVLVRISKYNEDADFFYFSYSDTGIGIPNEHLNRLFERFYRIGEGRTRDTGGSGLGLSIVKNAVMFHRGTITVKNRHGGGLEFLFKLHK